MAVYFDNKLQFPNPGEHSDLAWHPLFPLLAVATDHPATRGTVDIFTREGELIQDAVIRRAAAPTCLAWHPHKRILAAGFDSGEVLIWNDHDKELYQMAELHSALISTVLWNSTGTKIVSCDTEGIVALWKSDQKGRLQYTPVVRHNLSSPIVKSVLKPPDQAMDIKSLARAAVSGDESALDMFTWKKGKGSSKVGGMVPGEVQGFFIGCENGTVHYLHDNGRCTQSFAMQDGIAKLLYYEDKGILVTVTRNMNLSQHQVNNDGDCKQIMKVKLGGRADKLDIIMVGRGLLASASGEAVVRIWDFDREENYILTMDSLTANNGENSLHLYERNIAITSISYCPLNETLVAGTTCGQVASWQYDGRLSWEKRHEPESKWKLQPPSRVEGAITQINWQQRTPILAVNTENEVFLLSEQSISSHYNDQIAIVQNGANYLSVNNYKAEVYKDFKTDLQIKGVFTTKDYIAVWNGKKVMTYEYSEDAQEISNIGTIFSETEQVCMYEQNLYTMERGRIQVRTPQGTIKQTINLTDLEGDPVSLDVCGNFLVLATTGGFVKIYDISRREAKPFSTPKHLPELIPGFGMIDSVRCNCAGTRVSIVAKTLQGDPDPKLYIWDVESGTLVFFNLESGRGEQDDFDAETVAPEDIYSTDEERGKNQAAKDISGRYPTSHFWDMREPKLLVCEARQIRTGLSKAASKMSQTSQASHASAVDDRVDTMIVSLFATSENGILLQDNFALSSGHSKLIGLEVPNYYFIKKPEELNRDQSDDGPPSIQSPRPVDAKSPAKLVARRTMRDFVGLELSDKATTDAMMNFSYYLAIGNMDEAFRSIKLIKNESVWENMAKMCVKSRRLDVAAVCLGNMGHARGAKALREARALPELDAQVAVLAVQLGLTEDAERLLKNCGRYDILNDLYQSSGQWNKAIEVADMFDRVHLRRTHFNYAKHLESLGEVNAAIPNYEKSDTHRFEVPRMLFDEPQALEAYIVKTKDKALHKWWAQYMESAGEMEAALQFYEAAQDFLSLIRVYCYCNNLDKAADICNETGDPAGCYHLARQYENQERIKEAIHFFTRAQAYGNAIRLCKEHGMHDQMMNLALLGKPEDMMEAARFYELKPGYQDKAVMLYHKAGNVGKALELAFRTRQFGALQHISESLDNRADPELLKRCAAFFMENEQFDKAVDLLATGKKYMEALKLCLDQNVTMTEELAEKLTPEKDELDADGRMRVLNAIAEVCMQQRQYHLATKKYTQSGNKLQAMKALLKSGDTEKIIFFAGVSRQKEIYVMAANYLQSLDWRKEPDIMKNIIGFYTKGRALDSLANFYDACAQVEIDEYQNYEKALGALGEANKCLSKAKMPNQSLQEDKLAETQRKIDLIKKFVHARRLYDAEPDESMKMCQVLLEESDLDMAVRVGDVFGFMTEHFARKEKWRSALSCMEELQRRQPKVNLSYYISPKTVAAVYKAMNMPPPQLPKAVNGNSFNNNDLDDDETEGEIVDEDVVDDFIDQ